MMNKEFLKIILYLFVIGFVFFFCHNLFVEFIDNDLKLFFSLQKIYIFNLILTIFSLLILDFIAKKWNDKVGFSFLALGIIKMALSVWFLMPLINSNAINKVPDTLSFFFCYFLFLAIESYFVVKSLKTDK